MNKVVILVFFAFKMNAQDTITFPKIDLYKRNIVEVSYGKPLGQLSDKYESAINSAFYMRTKIARRQFIDFGVEIGAIVKGSTLDYRFENQKIALDGTKTSFLLGLRYTRFLYQSENENLHIESNAGIGWKYLYYQKPQTEPYKDIDLKPYIHTIAVSQGIKIMYHGFGVHCNYQYAPYELFNSKIEKNFGGSSLNFGVSGSWNF